MTIKYRRLDDQGDMSFGNGQADFLSDQSEAVAQAIWTRLRLWKGEWFLDSDAGMPYQQAALGVNKLETIEPAIRQRVLETQDVTDIEEFQLSIDTDTRVAKIEAIVNTRHGIVQLAGVL